MAQDDRKGQPPSTRGRSPAPTAPDTPDTRDINPPPPPEEPEAEPAPEPVDAMAGDGTVDAGTGEEADGGNASAGASPGSAGGKTESDRLRDEIAEAEKALEAKKAEFAHVEERRKAEEATAKMVADYAKEIPALTATEDGLRQYQLAETSFLSKFLDAGTMQNIADASAAQQRAIDDLEAKVGTKAKAVADKRAQLDAAKERAAAAKAKGEALKRPATSIRDRLKAADAVRTEAKKASDAGNYALAYWLIRDGGRLEEKIRAEPRVIPASQLEAAMRQSAADQAAAEREAAALEAEVKPLEVDLQADRAALAALKTSFEAKVRASLAQFNPKSAEAA